MDWFVSLRLKKISSEQPGLNKWQRNQLQLADPHSVSFARCRRHFPVALRPTRPIEEEAPIWQYMEHLGCPAAITCTGWASQIQEEANVWTTQLQDEAVCQGGGWLEHIAPHGSFIRAHEAGLAQPHWESTSCTYRGRAWHRG
jgi:hypothetical protein